MAKQEQPQQAAQPQSPKPPQPEQAAPERKGPKLRLAGVNVFQMGEPIYLNRVLRDPMRMGTKLPDTGPGQIVTSIRIDDATGNIRVERADGSRFMIRGAAYACVYELDPDAMPLTQPEMKNLAIAMAEREFGHTLSASQAAGIDTWMRRATEHGQQADVGVLKAQHTLKLQRDADVARLKTLNGDGTPIVEAEYEPETADEAPDMEPISVRK